jgi:hypothetical protein
MVDYNVYESERLQHALRLTSLNVSERRRLMGVSEIAELLNVSKQRASVLCNRKGFPDPVEAVIPVDEDTRQALVELYAQRTDKHSFTAEGTFRLFSERAILRDFGGSQPSRSGRRSMAANCRRGSREAEPLAAGKKAKVPADLMEAMSPCGPERPHQASDRTPPGDTGDERWSRRPRRRDRGTGR